MKNETTACFFSVSATTINTVVSFASVLMLLLLLRRDMHFYFLVEVLLLPIIFFVGCAAAAGACAAYNISTEAERCNGYCFFLLRFCPLHCDAWDVYCCYCSWLLLFLSFRRRCFGYGCWLRSCWDGINAGQIHKGCTPAASATRKGDIYVPGTYTKFLFLFPFDEIYQRLFFFQAEDGIRDHA